MKVGLTLTLLLCLCMSPEGRAQSLLLDALRPSPVPVSAADVEKTPHQAWQKECPAADVDAAADAEPACVLVYTGLADASRTRLDADSPLLGVYILPQGPGGAPLMILRTRLGFLLPEGVQVAIDEGRRQRLAFRSCHANARVQGCLVPVRVSGAFARAMRRGLVLTVRVRGTDGRVLSQPLSLNGITSGLADLAQP